MNTRGRNARGAWGVVMALSAMLAMGLVGCNGKDRPSPTPPTPPKQGSAKPELALDLKGYISNGKPVEKWSIGDEVSIWGLTKEGKQATPLSLWLRARLVARLAAGEH